MICEQCPFGKLVQTDSFIWQWHEYSYLAETCGNTHCKYFTVNGCIHPYVKDCENASLYWPWQLDYDNMEILIKKRDKINDKND